MVKELDEGGEKFEKMHRMEVAGERMSQEMRLVESVEGHSTTRTTNFFTSSPASLAEELEDFGFNDLEIYSLLRRCEQQAAAATGTTATSEGGDSNNVFAEFYQETRGKQAAAAGWTKEKQKAQQKLLKDTAAFLELPVLVKDEDAAYLGVTQRELDREFAHQKVDIVDESRVKLVLADLTDLQRKEIKRIR